MRALLQAVSDAWRNGGSGSTLEFQAAGMLGACYNGAASVLDGRTRGERLERWMFFITDDDDMHCVQLEGSPKQATFTPLPGFGKLPTRMASNGNEAVIEDEHQTSFEAGVRGASLLLNGHSNGLASVRLISIETRLRHTAKDAGGAHEETSNGEVQLHMWRRDIVEAVQAQFGLPGAASVPCKVWRALVRAADKTSTTSLESFNVAALLVCWQCGATAAGVRQCKRCGRASYCCTECQRAHYGSSHRRWCKRLAAEQRRRHDGPPSAAHHMYLEDMVAAVQRSPQAAALCNPRADEPLPVQLAAVDLMAALHVDEHGRPGPACNAQYAVCARSPVGVTLLALYAGRAGGAGAAPAEPLGTGAWIVG